METGKSAHQRDYLIGIARRLYANDLLALDLDETVYALDSTTIDLCLSVFLGRRSDPPRPP
jgi:hypothetical protein